VSYDTLASPHAGDHGYFERQVRRIADISALRCAFTRFAAWERERRVLRNQALPLIIMFTAWIMLMSWINSWEFASLAPAAPQTGTVSASRSQFIPAQSQSSAYSLPSGNDCGK